MRALNLHAVGDLRLDILPLPKRKSDEVLLKIHACGICGSDIPRIYTRGTYHFPTVLGHEFAGEIVEAEDLALIGRRATVFPLIPCGQCKACESGNYAQCVDYSYYGSRQDGGMAEYLAVKTANLCFFSDNIPYTWGAMSEPVAVARHALKKSGAGLGDSLLIYGIGAISLIIAQWARAAGVAKIILIGRTEEKVCLAKKMGFIGANICELSIDDILSINKVNGGMSSCIEATGSSEGLEVCIRCAQNFSNVVLLGNPIGEINLPQNVYWIILRKELNVVGTWNSKFSSYENDWRDAIYAMENGLIDLAPIITHLFPLREYVKAFKLMHEKKEPYLKVMFEMGRFED